MGLFGKNVEIWDDDLFQPIKEILRQSSPREKVYLVTPFIEFDAKIREAMKEATDNGVKVILLVEKGTKRNTRDCTFLANTRVEVRELEELHAKIYWCKYGVLITSINLCKSSDKNKEIGVWLEDGKSIKQVQAIIEKWLRQSEEVPATSLVQQLSGFCISCKTPIPFNRDKPYCKKHAAQWKEDGMNKKQKENYCHRCGEPWQTTINNPFCDKHK